MNPLFALVSFMAGYVLADNTRSGRPNKMPPLGGDGLGALATDRRSRSMTEASSQTQPRRRST